MRTRKSRYPSQIRTIRVKATDGDSGRETIDDGSYYRCWNCGFICDERRDDLSKDGRRGTVLTIYEGSVTPLYATGDQAYLSPGVGHDIVMLKENQVVYHMYTIGGSGCPLCHTRVYKKP